MTLSPARERTTGRARDLLAGLADPVEERLAAILPPAEQAPRALHRAMRHAVLGGGKRLRPRLVLAVAAACAAPDASLDLVIRAACAVELVHAASLVHDDLPSFDDAGARRGRPTVHVIFGEDIAVLTGDALLTLAFEVLAGAPADAPRGALELVRRLARATGSRDGIIGGQALEGEDELGPELFVRYHACKTAALFRFAAEAGALAAGGDVEGWADVGLTLGLAYQATDDLVDACGSKADAGKPVGQDRAHGRPNLVLREGRAAAVRRLESLLARAALRAARLAVDPTAIAALLDEVARGARALAPAPRRAPAICPPPAAVGAGPRLAT